MKLSDIRIDETTWESADDVRRREWRIAVDEMLADEDLVFLPGTSALLIHVTEQGFTMTIADDTGAELGRVEVPRDTLSTHVMEYVDIVRQMERSDLGLSSARIEALDMAKKVTHDNAARALGRACRPLGMDHATSRRLFTILFAIRVDTSRLTGVRGHRPVR